MPLLEEPRIGPGHQFTLRCDYCRLHAYRMQITALSERYWPENMMAELERMVVGQGYRTITLDPTAGGRGNVYACPDCATILRTWELEDALNLSQFDPMLFTSYEARRRTPPPVIESIRGVRAPVFSDPHPMYEALSADLDNRMRRLLDEQMQAAMGHPPAWISTPQRDSSVLEPYSHYVQHQDQAARDPEDYNSVNRLVGAFRDVGAAVNAAAGQFSSVRFEQPADSVVNNDPLDEATIDQINSSQLGNQAIRCCVNSMHALPQAKAGGMWCQECKSFVFTPMMTRIQQRKAHKQFRMSQPAFFSADQYGASEVEPIAFDMGGVWETTTHIGPFVIEPADRPD